MFICNTCSYSTTRKLNYERHKMSKKHIKNTEKNDDKNSIKINEISDIKNKQEIIINNNKYTDIKSEVIFDKISLDTSEIPSATKIVKLDCSTNTNGSLQINVFIENSKKTMLKVENYIVSFRYNWIDNECYKSVKISQVNCLKTDVNNPNDIFITDYNTSITHKYENVPNTNDNIIIILLYNYSWSNWRPKTTAFLTYNIQYIGSKDVNILN